MRQQSLNDPVRQTLVIQLICQRQRIGHSRPGGSRHDQRQRPTAGISTGRPDSRFPALIRAYDGIKRFVLFKKLKGPQIHLMIWAIQNTCLIRTDRPESI